MPKRRAGGLRGDNGKKEDYDENWIDQIFYITLRLCTGLKKRNE